MSAASRQAWTAAANDHALAVEAWVRARTAFLRRGASRPEVRAARRAMNKAAEALILATYADGREPSPYMIGALPRMYRQQVAA